MRRACGKLGALFTGVKAGGGCGGEVAQAFLPVWVLAAALPKSNTGKNAWQECLCHNGVAIDAPEVDFGKEKPGVRKMGGIDLPRGNEVLFGQIPLAQAELGRAELRVGQGIGGTDQHGIHVVLPGLVKVVQGDQDTTQIDQRLVSRGIGLESRAEALGGAVEFAGLVGDGAQFVPCRGELRRERDGMFQALHGGCDIAPAKGLLSVVVIAHGLLGHAELPGGNGAAAEVIVFV